MIINLNQFNLNFSNTSLLLAAWTNAEKVATQEDTLTECEYKCTSSAICSGATYNEDTKTCTLARVDTGPSNYTGLRVAWASSVMEHQHAWFAVDGNLKGNWEDKNLFHTCVGDDIYSCTLGMPGTHPWLAVDLVTPHSVARVEMVERVDCCADWTNNIEIRVGHTKPFDMGTSSDSLYNFNVVCGVFAGPGALGGNSSVTCSNPLIGRYVTLQRITSDVAFLSWVEVVIESEPVDVPGEMVEILTSGPAECPSSHPFTFSQGTRCCKTNLELGGWTAFGSHGVLHFDSLSCYSPDEPSDVACPTSRCMNNGYQRYNCYIEDLDKEGSTYIIIIL